MNKIGTVMVVKYEYNMHFYVQVLVPTSSNSGVFSVTVSKLLTH